MLWGRLTTIAIIAIHILHPCSYGRKVGLEAGVFPLLRTGAEIPDEMVEAYTAAGPLDKVRTRVTEAAERGDGVWLTPATYFIPPEQIGEYQRRIVEAFAPSNP